MKVVVIADNNPNPSKVRFRPTWGLSIYIETSKLNILFDAANNKYVIEENSRILGVNLGELDVIVLSHCHYDHVAGLRGLNVRCRKVFVPYPCEYFLKTYLVRRGFEVHEVKGVVKISDDIYLYSFNNYLIPEQILLIKRGDSSNVLATGCAHIGIGRILRTLKGRYNVNVGIVMGGIHMFDVKDEYVLKAILDMKSCGVKLFYPLHCSGENVRRYCEVLAPEIYGRGYVGLTLEL